jgi:regulatory protein
LKGSRQGHRSAPAAAETQPGFPEGEARLLDFREEAGSVQLMLDTGHRYEIAPGSVPAGLPPVGQVILPAVVREIALAAERKVVARLVFAMLDRRLQPLARLRGKLADRGHSEAAIEAVLAQMREQGVYSDRRYAEAFCRDCLLSRAVGRRYLVQKLRDQQVDSQLAGDVAAGILDPQTEAELAAQAATERWRRLRGAADDKALAKVVRFLLGRGFDAGLANQAARAAQPRSRRHRTEFQEE